MNKAAFILRAATPAIVLTMGLLASAPAPAGNRDSVRPVTLITRGADGNIADVRHSPDTRQVLGCSTTGAQIGQCVARDANGTARMCITTNPEFLRLIRTIRNDSRISFTADESGACVSFSVTTGSRQRPKRP